MNRFLLPVLLLVSALCCCAKPGGDHAGYKPTIVSCSAAGVTLDAEGSPVEIEVSAPVAPKVEIPSDAGWLSVKNKGFFKDYKLMFTISASANGSTAVRSAQLVVSASGVSRTATLNVTQAGKELVVEEVEAHVPAPEPSAFSDAFGLGWNLGNQFDAYYNGSWAGAREGYPDETAWGGTPATQATFDALKKAGFTSVRIPVSWLRMIGPAPDYMIDESWMNRVFEVAKMARKAGLYVIVNTHHDENHGVDNTFQWLDIKRAAGSEPVNSAIKLKIAAVWTQIANKFKGCGGWLMLEAFNEINDGGWGWSADFRKDPSRQCDILNQWNQVFVDAVRATGGGNATRWLAVPTYAANPQYEKYLALPADPAGRTALSVHFYDPWDYTLGEHQYSDWGHTGEAGKKADGGDEDNVRSTFGNLYDKYVHEGIPVYVGEFGCSMRDINDTRAWAFYLYYLEYVVKAAKTYGLPCILWDNGAKGFGQEKHGYFDHGTGEYVGNGQAAVEVMVKARFTEDASYTLQSVYDSAPRF